MEFSLEQIEPSLKLGGADISALYHTYLQDTPLAFHTPLQPTTTTSSQPSSRFHKLSSPEDWGEEVREGDMTLTNFKSQALNSTMTTFFF